MEHRFKNLAYRCGGCPTGSAKAGQIGLLGRAQEASAAVGCPIEFEQVAQFAVLPEGRADQGEEAGEAVTPFSQPGAEAQQHIRQQGGPDLPFDGAFAVAEEISQLEGLLEFLEEDFDGPAAAVEVGDGLRTPVNVVGQENHFAELAIDLPRRLRAPGAAPDVTE